MMPKYNSLKSNPPLRIRPLKFHARSTIIDQLLDTSLFEKNHPDKLLDRQPVC